MTNMNNRQKIFEIIAELEDLSAVIDRVDDQRSAARSGLGQPSEDLPLTAGNLHDYLRAQALREQFLGGGLFGDPAWIMIIYLMAARLSAKSVTITDLCNASGVPQTTALRWIQNLVNSGKFERKSDPTDGRRVFILLSEDMAEAFTRWYMAASSARAGKQSLL